MLQYRMAQQVALRDNHTYAFLEAWEKGGRESEKKSYSLPGETSQSL